MKDGFIKISCATNDIKVADVDANVADIINKIKDANEKDVKIICFPELCLTGYTCGDLFLQEIMLKKAKKGVEEIADYTRNLDIVSIVGLPYVLNQKLYNIAVVIAKGKVIGATAKQNIPNYSEFYELRHFTPADISLDTFIDFGTAGKTRLCTNQIFSCQEMPNLKFGIEICEDLWVPESPSQKLARAGATLIFNLSASDEVLGKASYRRDIIKAKSGSLYCAYAYADAGVGESTQDMVFAGHNIIAINGGVAAESELFENTAIIADVDVDKLAHERRRVNTFTTDAVDFVNTDFSLRLTETELEKAPYKLPFVPMNQENLNEKCSLILTMQAVGLATRLKHIGCKNVVLGLSGGLDSTLALIATVRAFDRLGLDKSGIHAITMPAFGTTDRTYNNACKLAVTYGATLEEINIKESVRLHFRDIGQTEENHDVTYENSQARERTQILMDRANMLNGIVVGTGDLSELALGWATYNGDHMSMYAVNSSIPKTLVRHIVSYEASCQKGELQETLNDIIDTPVSPELLPPDGDDIAQKTEDLVGPYELHDFFLYYMLRFGFEPEKIYRLACISFKEDYSKETIKKWLTVFYRRFFSQQFKRSCMPDGPKVGTVTLSPRGDFRMPSDAAGRLWLFYMNTIM